jgi:predicted dehydrogenase
MKTMRFGLIGCGLMGREFASVTARWAHLADFEVRPELAAICDRREEPFGWFRRNFPGIEQVTQDYRELLANPAVEAVYVAVPHHLHREIYCAAIQAGKHLMGEKPFGIDLAANQAIAECLREHPRVVARCATQWAFYPGAQRIGGLLERQAFGRIIEVNCGFLHSSDLDANKPLNWKRTRAYNGDYGVMGDLGMHALHLPLRAGWAPQNVRAVLSKIVTERPDGHGGRGPCETWDNAHLLCEALDPASGEIFPLTIRVHRIAPGQKNTWYLEVYGTRVSAVYSTREPKRLGLLEYAGGEQVWGEVQMGYETPFPTITGAIFEFGFTDALLQMWAAFLYELAHGRPVKPFAGTVTPAEAALSHRLFTAANQSQRQRAVVPV